MKAAEAFEGGLIDHIVATAGDLESAARDAVSGLIARRPRPSDDGLVEMIAEERATLAARTTPENMRHPLQFLTIFP